MDQPAVFCLFACERMNGYLGSLPTNHHSIEVQLMRKFTCTQQVLQLFSLSDETHLQDLLKNFQLSKGSLNYEDFSDLPVPSRDEPILPAKFLEK